MSHRNRVLIVGGGFAGLCAAKALRRAPVEVTVVERANHHLFQPLLYQVSTGILAEGEIAPPLRGVLRRQANARVLLAEVTGFDPDARAVHATAPDGERPGRARQGAHPGRAAASRARRGDVMSGAPIALGRLALRTPAATRAASCPSSS